MILFVLVSAYKIKSNTSEYQRRRAFLIIIKRRAENKYNNFLTSEVTVRVVVSQKLVERNQ